MARQTKGKGKATSRGSDDEDVDCCGNSDQARNIGQALEKAKKRKATGKTRPVDSEEEVSSEDEQVVENARLRADNKRFTADNEHLMAKMAEIRLDHTNGAVNGAPAAKPKKAPVPDKKTEVTIWQLHMLLGLEENKIRWLEIHSIIRDLISRVGLDFSLPWKLQDKTQLSTLYSLVRN
ncbi:hypothetical protein FRC10_001727 [Ceratobasidium sp. 414]|nr:hypothetical protein FRC10_001727 [Ceratobasidium sp. 414]